MAEFDLQRVLEGMDTKITEARDAALRAEGRLASLAEQHANHERRLADVEHAIDVMQDEKAEADAVRAYRGELRMARRWILGLGVSVAGVAVAVVAVALNHA